MQTILDGFAIFDRDNRLVLANQAFLSVLDGVPEVTPGITYDRLCELLVSERIVETQPDGETWCAWMKDRWRQNEIPPVILRLSDGQFIKMVDRRLPDGGRAGLRIDITKLKTQQIELTRLAEAAEAASRANSAFLSNMSHEIRTPMNGLLGMSDLLLATPLDQDQREMAETLRRSAEGLLGLLDDVLDFSQAEGGRIALDPAPVQPRDLLAETVASFSAEALTRGLTLTLDISGNVPPVILTDARRVRRIMANLLGNAVKFTRSGGVTARGTVPGDTLSIAVEDTGPGIPPDRAARIFDGFVQVQEGHDRQHDGPGLGLALCNSLVTQMGGRIDYRPRPGGGSVFEVGLPLHVAPRGPASATGRPSAIEAPIRRVRVLAAEDNATNRFVLTRLLEPLDVDLRVVERGADCLAEAMRDPPDLMLTDISMPDMDGLEMTRRLRAWEAEMGRPPLRVVAVTAHALTADIEKILSAGLDRVLTKPLKRALLVEECAPALSGAAQVTLAAAPASDTSPA